MVIIVSVARGRTKELNVAEQVAATTATPISPSCNARLERDHARLPHYCDPATQHLTTIGRVPAHGTAFGSSLC